MSEITILMAVYNAEDYITESIESILNQSFHDFELIIVNRGSTDNTNSIISSYDDKRINLINSEYDNIQSLNLGLKSSKGKYIINMDICDLMHVDRLRLHYSTMEEFPEITICGSWTTIFGVKMNRRISDENISGILKFPLIQMILDETIFNIGYMIRKSFINRHHLFFKSYANAENFKLMAEIVDCNGVFYMESQPLLYTRITEKKISRKRRMDKLQTVSKIKKEILNSLCNKNKTYPALISLCDSYFELANQELISENEIFKNIHSFLLGNKEKLNVM